MLRTFLFRFAISAWRNWPTLPNFEPDLRIGASASASVVPPRKHLITDLPLLMDGNEGTAAVLRGTGSSTALGFDLRSMTGARTWPTGRGLASDVVRLEPGWMSGMVLAAAFFSWMCDCISLTPLDQPTATVAGGAPSSSSSYRDILSGLGLELPLVGPLRCVDLEAD